MTKNNIKKICFEKFNFEHWNRRGIVSRYLPNHTCKKLCLICCFDTYLTCKYYA